MDWYWYLLIWLAISAAGGLLFGLYIKIGSGRDG